MTAKSDLLAAAQCVADAVLFEGYLLYPYRASSSKNQVRWQFGVLGPAGAVEAMVGEDSTIYTECLLVPPAEPTTLDIHMRFLQTQWREPQRCVAAEGDEFEPVQELLVGATRWIAWHEAVERAVILTAVDLEAVKAGHELEFAIAGGEDIETVYNEGGAVAGRLVRTRYPLAGRIRVSGTTEETTPTSLRVRVTVENSAVLANTETVSRTARRDLVARQSLVGTHLLLVADAPIFVSIENPPEGMAGAAAACGNSRCWPVLAGAKGENTQFSEIVLGSPIILGDFPAIADESPGQLFDSAEIDEILTLRIMTMTDDEKIAARGTDPRAAAIIDRSEDMPPEVFERLHGALRSFDPPARSTSEPLIDFPSITTSFDPDGELVPWFSEAADAAVTPNADVVMVRGVPVSRDSRVRLRPTRQADAHDMFLAGQVAIVRRIDLDVDGAIHVAVLLEDDPAADLHDWHGRYYYFDPSELEPIASLEPHGVES